MRKGRELISLPVVDSTSGNQLGEIKELIISNEGNLEIKGLIIEDKRWFREAKFLSYEKIKQLSKEALTIEDENEIKDIGTDIEIKNYYLKQKEDNILGKKIINRDGESLGFIGDVLITPETGIIVGYELSDGFVQDLLEGRNYIAIPKDSKQDKDSICLFEDPLFINPLFEINKSIES